ncbi:MAG: DNA polymerase III subunit gamma/tau [Candidatus Zixiibacteriota bacterium]
MRTINNSMSYQVLARKYRPQQFDDVIAQEHVTRTLKNAIKNERLSSGYLFTGPRGTGKTTTARLLAKAVNCAEGPTPTPCDKCDSCKEIISGSALDVLEIDAASNTGVDDMRTLRENVRYMPTTGKKRIYIIDEVHRLSGSAFDALLKTLEEPPDHVLFIFATTEPHKVPETIRSRTQRYDFRRVAVADLSSHLKKIAETEKIAIDDEALFVLARKADGSVRDAMSLLDQMSAFASEGITGRAVVEALGLIDRQFFFEYIKAIAAKDCAESLEQIKRLVDSGIELSEFVSGLAGHFRTLLILKNAKEPERLLELSESEMESFREQVNYFSNGDILRLIKMITNLSFDIKSGLDQRLLLETATVRMACMEATVLFEDVLAHISGGVEVAVNESGDEEKDLFGGTTVKAEIPAAVVKEAEPTGYAGGRINLPMVQTSWMKFVDYLKNKNRMLAALLGMAEIRDVKENVITAVFPTNGTNKQIVEKKEYKEVIVTHLSEFYKVNLKINFEIDANKKANPAEEKKTVTEMIDADKILAEDERLRSLIEKFDGELIGKKEVDE